MKFNKGESDMKKCYIKLINNKWIAEDETGKRWCGFDIAHKQWAIDVAKANGFIPVVE